MSDQEELPQEARQIPIEWHIPESITAIYATNMVVQHSEYEFIVSFFETKPPLIVGTVTKEVLDSVKSIQAECVAQIIVAAGRMPAFIKALQTNLETFNVKQASIQETEEK
jgi:hypothetical protein